ncbi:MAG: EAL domain-containing protein [Bacilli bacterium]|nr:EAL domain-containing protein [Bacilli bacterium]
MNFFRKLSNFLGFSRSTPYGRDYLIETNLRTSVYMSAIIVVLEVAMILRRVIEAFVDPANHTITFHNTFPFVLMLSVGVGMFGFALVSLRRKVSFRSRCISNLICATPALVSGLLFPFETFSSSVLKNTLVIALYVSVAAFGAIIIIFSAIGIKTDKRNPYVPIAVVTLFALACLTFGIRVGYSDWTDPTGYDIHASKQIIAFLMMAFYVGCLVIWRPFISIAILGTAFSLFYAIIASVDPSFRSIPEGDTINYITFFISLVVVCFSIYHQRIRDAESSEKLEALATIDTLTGLLSFDHFLDQIHNQTQGSQALMEQRVYLFLNVGSFRIYNDHYGFAAGNVLLTKIANILTARFPDSLICRISDDRFAVFTYVDCHYERFVQANADVIALEKEIAISLRAGCYVHHSPYEDVHRCVDKARYACTEGKERPDHFATYDQEMHNRYHLMQYIVRSVDRAAEEGRILVHYQPIVWADDGSISCVEALARWDDPRYGFLYPGSFVPFLENAQMIHRLDAAVIDVICRNIRTLLDMGLPVVPTSVNFSRLDFQFMDVVGTVEAALSKYGVPKEYLHIEITESALAEDEVTLKSGVTTLAERGYQLWIDDFGSGYSHFNALKEFDFQVLKLDMELLKDIDTNPKAKPLVEFLVQMSSSLGLQTVAEGVENEEVASFLRSVGISRMQGYYFGKPMSFQTILEQVHEGKIHFKPDVVAEAEKRNKAKAKKTPKD